MALGTRLSRLKRLEAAYGGGGDFPPCPDCGNGGDGAGDEDVPYEIVFDDDPDEPACCPSCGLGIPVIVFDDVPDTNWRERSPWRR